MTFEKFSMSFEKYSWSFERPLMGYVFSHWSDVIGLMNSDFCGAANQWESVRPVESVTALELTPSFPALPRAALTYKQKRLQLKTCFRRSLFHLYVIPLGFKPKTFRTGIWRSIQLSYGTFAQIWMQRYDIKLRIENQELRIMIC